MRYSFPTRNLPCVTRGCEARFRSQQICNRGDEGLVNEHDNLQQGEPMLGYPTALVKPEMSDSGKMLISPTGELPPTRDGEEASHQDALLGGQPPPEMHKGQFVGIFDQLAMAWLALASGPAAQIINRYLEEIC